MAEQNPIHTSAHSAPVDAVGDSKRTTQVLCADPDRDTRLCMTSAFAGSNTTVECVSSLAEARSAIAAGDYDVLLIADVLPDGSGFDLVREQAEVMSPTRSIVLSVSPDLKMSIASLRSGATDILGKPLLGTELRERTASAAMQAHRLRAQRLRTERLKRICKRLNTAREEVTGQVDELCNDLITAYHELADQVSNVSLTSEFSSLVRQELDVESLLRTVLEYMLVKTGPTNAAVFLPTGHDEFSLGAYVNYDAPKETADVLLDHLADVLPGQFEDEHEMVSITDAGDLAQRVGSCAVWMGRAHMVVMPCRHDDECMAVVALFRDEHAPFSDELLDKLQLMRMIFGEQLARVVHLHNRHLPKDHWPGFDIDGDESDYDDLAA